MSWLLLAMLRKLMVGLPTSHSSVTVMRTEEEQRNIPMIGFLSKSCEKCPVLRGPFDEVETMLERGGTSLSACPVYRALRNPSWGPAGDPRG